MTLPYSTQAGKIAYQEATALWRAINFRAGDFKALRGLSADLKQLSSIRTGARAAANPISSAYKKLEFDIGSSNKKISGIQKVTDALKKGAFKEINPKWGIAANTLLQVVQAGITILAVKSAEEIQAIDLRTGKRTEADLQSAFTRSINNSLSIRNIREQITREIGKINKDLSSQARAIFDIRTSARETQKKANDALYEVRAGRKILEDKISAQAQRLNEINTQVRTAFQGITKTVQDSIRGSITDLQSRLQTANASISKLNSDIASQNSKINSEVASIRSSVSNIKPQQPVDINSIVNSARNAAQQEIFGLRTQVNGLQTALSGLTANLGGVQRTIPTLTDGLSNVASASSRAQSTADAAMREAKNKGIFDTSSLQRDLDNKFNQFVQQNNQALRIKDLQISDLSKQFDKQFTDFQRQSQLTADQRFNQFIKSNNEALQVKDLQISDLSKQFDKQFTDFQRQSQLTADQRFNEFIKSNNEALRIRDNNLNQFKNTTDTKFREIEKVNEEGNRKLDQLIPKIDSIIPTIAGIPIIVGKAVDGLRPSIPTITQIEQATGTAMCRNLQTGCGRKAIDDAVGNVTNNVNQHNTNNTGSVLDAINTGANAALLQGQQTILQRLGDQLPGGIGGKLTRFSDWLKLDRVLNVLTTAATVHNAFMLSNDIGQTLLGIINNVLQLIGLKDDNGQPFDIDSIISSTIENFIKSIVGADNYQTITIVWAKANRIYQATTNVLNSFLSLSQLILQANELIAAYTGKIGNALKRGGVVLENAYGWMNPQPKFNRVSQFLENVQNAASTVQMVTQVPLDIANATTELANASTEFVNAVKEDDKPENKANNAPEPEVLKAQELLSKNNSQPTPFDFSDLFDGED